MCLDTRVSKCLDSQRASVETWQKNVDNTVIYKTKHQGTLSREQLKETMLAGGLAISK
jgi:hypothetical protein